jgi:hypothetical protein
LELIIAMRVSGVTMANDPNLPELLSPERAALAAFQAAEGRGLPTVDCYKAAAQAYGQRCPGAAPAYCSRQAARIVLDFRYLMLRAVGEA